MFDKDPSEIRFCLITTNHQTHSFLSACRPLGSSLSSPQAFQGELPKVRSVVTVWSLVGEGMEERESALELWRNESPIVVERVETR